MGVFGQRWVDNDQFHYAKTHVHFSENPYYAHRVNMNYGMDLLWNTGDFVFTMKLQRTHMFNYGRFTYGTYLGYGDRRFENDEYNTQVQFSIRYLLQ
ncbi:MAG: hypothetical protein U5K31_02565 [Balneolaceae bacterium]|nr:hypothetical protein [Balneolaceae bacterium]